MLPGYLKALHVHNLGGVQDLSNSLHRLQPNIMVLEIQSVPLFKYMLEASE